MSQEENADVVVEKTDTDPDGIAPQEGEPKGDEETQGSESVEIVREGRDSRPQTDKTKMISDRINKVNNIRFKAESRAELAEKKNTKLERELDVYRAGDKIAKPTEKPNPDDFDDGTLDPDYIKQADKFDDERLERRLDAQVQKINENRDQETRTDKRLQSQEEHYERSIKLGARDFNETEDRAIEHLGDPLVQDIIASFQGSEIMIYYLGKKKNKQEALDLRDLIKRDKVAGIFALGELSQSLRVKSTTKDVPDPDEPLDGATPPRNRQRGPKGATYE